MPSDANAAKQLRLPKGVAKPSLDQYGNPVNGAPRRQLVHPQDAKPPAGFGTDPDESAEPAPKPDSGLSQLDPAHIFASVIGATIARPILLVAICIITFGLVESCNEAAGIFSVWRTTGLKGLIIGALSAPGTLFAAPLHWVTSLLFGMTDPMGVPYLMLVLAGCVLAIRTEIDLVKMLFFYAIASAIHAAGYFHMKHPLSWFLWIFVVGGYVWAFVWYSLQSRSVEEE